MALRALPWQVFGWLVVVYLLTEAGRGVRSLPVWLRDEDLRGAALDMEVTNR